MNADTLDVIISVTATYRTLLIKFQIIKTILPQAPGSLPTLLH